MTKTQFLRILCIALIAVGFYILCTDAISRWFSIGQYAFNICYFAALPALIGGAGWPEYIENLK